METSSHGAGREVRDGQAIQAALRLSVDEFVRNDFQTTLAVREIEQFAVERSLLWAVDPEQFCR